MSTGFRKAVRDLWLERTRTALVVLAIALGIAGFTSMLASYAVLVRELDRGYLATNPAALTLRVDRVNAALLAAVRAHLAVTEAEPRRVLTGRMRAGPVEWRNLTLFVVEDFGAVRVSTLVSEEGAWPPARGEILLERDALRVAHAGIGDTVTLRLQQGEEHALRVSGSVHDVGQAQARMENSVYGYVALDTLAELGEEPFLDQVKVALRSPTDGSGADGSERDRYRRVGAELEALALELGREVRGLDVPPPGKHPHADIMGLLMLAKAAFGLFVLALSGVLVFNLLTALMAAQARQIGVMKALGGTRARIARLYLVQALFLGLAALVLGLPAGLAGSRVLCRKMAVLLNFDIESFAVPMWVFALAAGVGLALPLLAAALPVWWASAISVREALAQHGVRGSVFGTSAFERALAGVGGASRPLLFALRNAFRRRTRLVLTLGTLAASGVFFLTALNVRASLIHTLDRLFETTSSDLSVTLASLSPREPLERALAATPGISSWEGWVATEASVAGGEPLSGADSKHADGLHGLAGAHGASGNRASASGAKPFTVLALPPESALVARHIVEGRDLLPGETDALVVNSRLAGEQPELRPGSTVTLAMGPSELPWRVVGVAREPFSPRIAYASRAIFDEHGGHAGASNSLRLVLEATDPASVERVREALDRELEREGLRALGSRTEAESRYGFDQHMLMLYVFLLIVSGVLAAVGGLGLATTLSLNVTERRAELGVLRALGATPAVLTRLVVVEGLVIAVLAWAAAGLVAWPLGSVVGDALVERMLATTLDFAFEGRALALWLAFSLALGALASFLPAWHASRRPVREALAHE